MAPDSVPSATTAVAPRRATRRASATEATTGMTLMPASFHAFMYLAGLPARHDDRHSLVNHDLRDLVGKRS